VSLSKQEIIMPFEAPEIPTALTHAYWNKKKGVIARMKNDVETGIGEAADEVKEKFKKIEWGVFDIHKTRPAGNGAVALKQLDTRLEDMKAEWTKNIKPAIEAVKVLGTKAKDAAPELTKAKYADAAKGALEIAKEAAAFSLSLQLNGSFYEGVLKEFEKVKEAMAGKQEDNAETVGDPKIWLNKVINGLKVLTAVKAPLEGDDAVVWREEWKRVFEKNVKQNGRSLGNTLKTVPKLAKHLKPWADKFVGFDPDAMPYFKGELTPAQVMAQSKKLFVDVLTEAKELQKDL
jgi:hypothetical protein